MGCLCQRSRVCCCLPFQLCKSWAYVNRCKCWECVCDLTVPVSQELGLRQRTQKFGALSACNNGAYSVFVGLFTGFSSSHGNIVKIFAGDEVRKKTISAALKRVQRAVQQPIFLQLVYLVLKASSSNTSQAVMWI